MDHLGEYLYCSRKKWIEHGEKFVAVDGVKSTGEVDSKNIESFSVPLSTCCYPPVGPHCISSVATGSEPALDDRSKASELASRHDWLWESEKNPVAQMDAVSCGKSVIDDVGVESGPGARPLRKRRNARSSSYVVIGFFMERVRPSAATGMRCWSPRTELHSEVNGERRRKRALTIASNIKVFVKKLSMQGAIPAVMGKKMCRQERFGFAATCLLLTSAEFAESAEIEVERDELVVRWCESATPGLRVAA
ncbi:unnamed protein product [Peronospora belbahrii]|uniref:Uncharacterized protein n=1 Tax=Peronospora belbahrii TaxID=622444 RepID=A0ABN8DBY9_9STRA|nr:unnamed protein product [Peronospora belbahrii]